MNSLLIILCKIPRGIYDGCVSLMGMGKSKRVLCCVPGVGCDARPRAHVKSKVSPPLTGAPQKVFRPVSALVSSHQARGRASPPPPPT